MNKLNQNNYPQPLFNHLKNAKQTIFLIIDKELNILEYNKCFSKLLEINTDNIKNLDQYLKFYKNEELSLEKLLKNPNQFQLYTKKKLPLSFKCELGTLEENYLLIGEAEFTFDINVIENITKITSELAATTMELHKKNSLLDQAKHEIEEQHNMIVNQSRFVAINELLLMLAHQWRQPLSVVNMYNNLIKMELECLDGETESLTKYLDESEKAILQLSQTIELFTKQLKNKDIQHISVNSLIEDIIILLQPNFTEQDISLTKELNSKDTIDIETSTFTQLSIIILQNTFDAFEKKRIEDKKITIKSYDEKDYVVVEYQDNGGGIDKDIILKIFDPYFSTKDQKNNTGLGLYTAYTLTTEVLQGLIEIHNKDNGISVQVRIPK